MSSIVNLTLKKSGYVNPSSPNTVFPTNTSTWYNINGPIMFFGFNAMPSSLKRKALISARLRLQYLVQMTTSSSHDIYTYIFSNTADFNPSTLTFNNRPLKYMPDDSISCSLNSGSADVWAIGDSQTRGNRFASQAIRCGVQMDCAETLGNAFVKTVLAGGGLPYLEVTYDEATTVRSQVGNLARSSSGAQNPAVSSSFTWALFPKYSDGYCADENWTQASAKFFWRVSGASSWNTVNISGATTGVTIPAATFPPASTIECYVQATDTEGTTSSTGTMSFSTASVTLSLNNTPSGNNIDSRSARTITWTLKSGNYDYPQSSAAFYWRISGASSWNAITVSGNTKSLTIPAYRFPPGSAIEWYFSCTPTGSSAITTSTASFTTAATSFKMLQYPTGSNIDTRQSLVFSWSIYTTHGEYQQTSAKFYWRVSDASSWTQVAISGDVKSITMPANTFPTGKTIQFYVEATPAGGTTHTGSTYSFTTVSPKITATLYPSGSAVESGGPLTFEWAFRSAVGDFAQTSAKLYWRASTSDPYTAINASGATQSITVPKNTFPGNGSTIYWYLEGTDTGGYTSQTSVTSFKTVTSQITAQDSPTSGYRDPRYAITFSWYFATPKSTYDQSSAALHWRVSGASSWNNVSASGSTQSVTIAANTFPLASTIEWYLSGTDAGGCTSQTTVYSFSTAASTAYAVLQTPVGIVEDGTKPITFRWSVQTSDGASPTRMQVWWKLPTESSSEWHLLFDTTDQIFSYTTPSNTFNAGPVEWRVQATNRDGVAGPYAEASFVVLRAPDAPDGLQATAVPRTTISWQSTGQEAYEIIIDGNIVRSEFSPTTYSWQIAEPLADGIHVIRVRIQGSYSLWSEYAETTISIQNEPDGSITLTGEFDVDALLTAQTNVSESVALNWYRDGKRIGETSAGITAFADRFVLGDHSYFVEMWLSDGNYTRSNSVTGTMKSCITRIAATAGGNWIDLRLSENSDSIQGFSWSRSSSLQHITAAAYPILELSPYQDRSGRFECAFANLEEAAAFEELFGHVVIVKSRGGQVIIGGLTSVTKQMREFYITYAFSVNQINWEDFIHDTSG